MTAKLLIKSFFIIHSPVLRRDASLGQLVEWLAAGATAPLPKSIFGGAAPIPARVAIQVSFSIFYASIIHDSTLDFMHSFSLSCGRCIFDRVF
jgi:hypothetical protein